MDIDAGIVMINLYPLAAATKANAIPVFPEVGSLWVVYPGRILPVFSASRIIEYPILSLTEQAGLKYSNFTAILALHPPTTFLRYTIGVFPMRDRALSPIELRSAMLILKK